VVVIVFSKLCREADLNPPEFIQEEIFRTIIWRPVTDQVTVQATVQATGQVTGQATGQAAGQVSGQVPEEVRRLMLILKGEIKRAEMQEILGLKHRAFFNDNYLQLAIDIGLLELVFPQIPFHPKQAYRLSKKGKALKRSLKAKDKKS